MDQLKRCRYPKVKNHWH